MKNCRKLVISFRYGIIAFALTLASLHVSKGASISLDPNFSAPLFTTPDYASRALLMPDGKYVVSTLANTLTDQPAGAITRYFSDGTLDNTFNFSRDYDSVFGAAALQDGRLIVAASQDVYGVPEYSYHILRLNTDGSIDPTFNTAGATTSLTANPQASLSGTGVRAIAIQPDGKILLAGFFGDFGGAGHPGIVRLLADGTLDPGFAAITLQFTLETEFGLWAKPAIQEFDDKILIVGDFEGVNNVPCPGVARLTSDGALDATFNATGFTRITLLRPIRGVVVQSDGKIVIGGSFNVTGGPQDVPLIRLNGNGSLDQSYVYPAGGGGVFGRIKDLILQPNDKPIAAGNSVFRFNTNGSLDATFTKPVLIDSSPQGFPQVYSLNLQSDSKVLVGGAFSDVNGGPSNDDHFSVARFNSNGTLDTTLATSHKTAERAYPTSFARQFNGVTLIGFNQVSSVFNPAIPHNFGRLFTNGSLDPNFDPLASVANGSLRAVGFTTLVDGKIFGFARNDLTDDFGYTLFLPNGTLADPSYKDDDQVKVLGFSDAYPLPYDKVLVGDSVGAQSTVNNTELQRLNSDGHLDQSFQLDPIILNDTVQRDVPGGSVNVLSVGSKVLAIFDDGKILFSYLAIDSTFRLVRLKANGSLDASFQPGSIAANTTTIATFVDTNIASEISALSLGFSDAQSVAGGKVIVVGDFADYNGTIAHGIVRLKANGTVDSSFQAGGGAQWTQTTETATLHPAVDNIELENDGKFLITGTFEAFDGAAAPGIATLNADGSFFASLDQIASRQKFDFFTSRALLARQADGSFLLSGPFSLPNQTLSPSFIHIKSVGAVPIVGSPTIASVAAGHTFTYQTVASGQPTNYSATGLPPGFTINSATGLISGSPIAANVGIYTVTIRATNGEGTGPARTLVIIIGPNTFPIATQQRSPTQAIAFDGINYLVGLRRNTGTAGEPRAQLVSQAGALVGSQISTGRTGKSPFVSFNGTNYLLAWRDNTTASQIAMGQLINKAGAKVGGTFRISQSNSVSNLDAIVGNPSFGGDKYLVTWTDDRRGTGSADHDIYARFISGSGTPLGSDFKISGTAGADSAAAFDGANYLVTWREDVNDTDIYGRLVDPSGVLVTPPFLIDGNAFPSDSSPPAVLFDGTKYLVVFTDEVGGQGSETWDLFGRFVTTAGAVQATRITIDNATEAQQYPAIAFDGSQYLVTWNNGLRFSDANATNVTINGRFFHSTGSVASAKLTLFTPEGSKLPLFAPVLFDSKRFFAVGSLGDTVVDGNNAITDFTNITVDGQFVVGPPTITSPLSATATKGQQFVYQIIATRSPTSYDASGLPPGLSINNLTGVISGVPTQARTSQITIEASNASGTDTAILTLTVTQAPAATPVITSGTSQTGRTGQPFTFQVLASGTSPAARVSATGLPPGLKLDAASGLISGIPIHDGSFRVTITITDGSKSTTGTLQLTFTSDPGFPVITSPKSAALAAGQPFSYKIIAPTVTIPSDHTTFSIIGTLPTGLTFNAATATISGTFTGKDAVQRRMSEHIHQGDTIIKALNDSPVITTIQTIAHNSHGTGIQPLNLLPPAANPMLNISSRLSVQTGDNVLIAGLVIIGSDSKKVIVRGIGPSLTGVPGALANPTLELHDGTGRLIRSNDNWKSTQQAEIQATGIPPTNDLESAIVETLAPGRYTAILRGKNSTTGIGLVEAYDLNASITSKLANISTRAFVSTGDNVMIDGFIVGATGTGQRKIIIRAIGPSLTGVNGALQDPTLELHNSTGATIASNDNWRDTQQAEIQATGIPPADIRESAIVKTLTPGRYTAIVRGKNGTTGVGLVEIYALQ